MKLWGHTFMDNMTLELLWYFHLLLKRPLGRCFLLSLLCLHQAAQCKNYFKDDLLIYSRPNLSFYHILKPNEMVIISKHITQITWNHTNLQSLVFIKPQGAFLPPGAYAQLCFDCLPYLFWLSWYKEHLSKISCFYHNLHDSYNIMY